MLEIYSRNFSENLTLKFNSDGMNSKHGPFPLVRYAAISPRGFGCFLERRL